MCVYIYLMKDEGYEKLGLTEVGRLLILVLKCLLRVVGARKCLFYRASHVNISSSVVAS